MSKMEFGKTQTAYEDGSLNHLIYKHQGLIMSDFVEYGAVGFRKGLFNFASDVSQASHTKVIEYDTKSYDKVHNDVLRCMVAIGRDDFKSSDGLIDEYWVKDYLVEHKLPCNQSTKIVQLCVVGVHILGNVSLNDIIEKMGVDAVKMLMTFKEIVNESVNNNDEW